MALNASEAEIAGANAYENLFVPALFRQWAPRVADAAGVKNGDRVLDVACGTGIAAREALSRVGPGGSVAGVDPAPGMLAVARRLAPAIDFRQGTAEELPFPDGAFDAVLCQFGLMFFADRPRAIGEMLRVLIAGGRLGLAVWSDLDSTPAYAEEVALLERLAGARAADALRAPFVLGDRPALARLLERAGVSDLSITTQPGSARFPSVRAMVEADLRGWLPLMGVPLDEPLIQRILGEAEVALAPFRTDTGELVFDAPAHVAAGRKRRARIDAGSSVIPPA